MNSAAILDLVYEHNLGGATEQQAIELVEAALRQASATVPEGMALVPLDKLALAYGMLWHVNADLDAPALVKRPSLTPAQGAHKARRVLYEMLTHPQRGDGINAALDVLAASQPDAGKAQHDPKCASLTQLLLSNPPKPAKCDCGADKAQGVVR